MKIPSKFQVGGQKMNVVIKDNLDGKLGCCCLGSGVLSIAESFKGERQSSTSMLNTFYHELTHCILDTMGEESLSADEKFVSSFSSFLTEALCSMEKSKVLYNFD